MTSLFSACICSVLDLLTLVIRHPVWILWVKDSSSASTWLTHFCIVCKYGKHRHFHQLVKCWCIWFGDNYFSHLCKECDVLTSGNRCHFCHITNPTLKIIHAIKTLSVHHKYWFVYVMCNNALPGNGCTQISPVSWHANVWGQVNKYWSTIIWITFYNIWMNFWKV